MKKNFLKFSLMLIVITVSIIGMVIVSNAATTKEGILPFEDVKSSYWYADAAEFCYVNGIVNGMDDHTFAPANTLTRAQFVTMLVNIEGVDVDYYSTSQFSDVKPSHWYYGAVAWAYKNGIVSGTSTTTFSPNAPINRETLARMMSLYMQKKDYYVSVDDSCLNKFTDRGTISNWAIEGMKYSVSAELISGMTSNTLEPKTTVTRAQAVRIIMLYMEKYYFNCDHTFSDVSCVKSSECTKCGMKNGLPMGHTVSDTFSCKSTGTVKCTVCNSNVKASQMTHDHAAATCGRPETCKRCGATRGKATGNHTWWAATCTKPKMCKVCYQTSGTGLGHKWQNAANVNCLEHPKCTRCGGSSSSYGDLHNWGKATCTTPSKCVRCNKSSGTTAPHTWLAATCTNPKMCKVCYTTEGSALGHTTFDGVCGRCKQKISVDMRKLIGHPDSCKTTSFFGFCYYKNSVDGIKVCWGGENLTGKTINYYTITVYFYNSVGDPAYSEFSGKNYKTVKYVGPVAPNKDLILYGIVDYVPACSKVVIGEIDLEFSDGTEASGWYGYGTTYRNSAIK